MTFEVFFMLALLLAALVLFASEVLPIEVTALVVLGALLASGVLTVEEALAGFSNKAVITIGALFILSSALTKTGVVRMAAERLAVWAGTRYWLGLGSLLLAVGVLSGFLNNTAIVAIFVPLALDLCSRLQVSPSKLLLPLSYASIFGGTLTLIGTSTNLLVSSIAEGSGEPAFGMFEFLPVGLVFLVLGLTYVLIFANRLLPERVQPGDPTVSYGLGSYLSEVRVDPGSPLIGQSCRDAELGGRFGVNVLGTIRAGQRLAVNFDRLPLKEDDLLIVQGGVDDLLQMRRDLRLSLLPEVKLSQKELADAGAITVEMLVAPRSSLVGRTLKQANFRGRYDAFVMAIRRHSATLREKIAHTVLKPWDALLVLLPRDRLAGFRSSRDLFVLTELPIQIRRQRFWWLVLVVLPVVVLLAGLGVVDIAAGALLGAVVLLVFRQLSPSEAYGAVQWQVVFLIAAFVPVGQAAISTGTSDFIAEGLLWLAGLVPLSTPYVVLALLYLATSLLTQIVTNAAAAIILAPVALSLAAGLGVEPRAFLMAVCFAASAEFMTPVGYQTNLMVYAPGGYRFLDYTRFGAPLNLMFWLTASLLLPVVWPF